MVLAAKVQRTFAELLVCLMILLEILDFLRRELDYSANVSGGVKIGSNQLTVIQTLAMLVDMLSGESGRHPGAASDVVVNVRHFWQHTGNDLDATGPVANDGNALILS